MMNTQKKLKYSVRYTSQGAERSKEFMDERLARKFAKTLAPNEIIKIEVSVITIPKPDWHDSLRRFMCHR